MGKYTRGCTQQWTVTTPELQLTAEGIQQLEKIKMFGLFGSVRCNMVQS